MDTSGFYKLDQELLFAPNFVDNIAFSLLRERHTEYLYPVEGWTWFNSEALAREAFNLPAVEAAEGDIHNE